MRKEKPSYEELEARLVRAEAMLDVLREGQVDAVVGKEGVFLLRMHEMVEESRRRRCVIEAVNRIFEGALTRKTEEEVGLTCLSVIEEMTSSEFGFIGELGPDGVMKSLTVSSKGIDLCGMQDRAVHQQVPGGFPFRGLYGFVLEHGESLLTNHPSEHPESRGLPERHPPLSSFLGVPLLHDGKVFGVIAVANRPGGYRASDRQSLEEIAPAVVQAYLRKRDELRIQKLLAETEFKVLERTDQLTQQAEALGRANLELRQEVSKRKELSERLVQLLESDRRALADVLHDSMGQNLVNIRSKLERLRAEETGIRQREMSESLGELQGQLLEVIEQTRTFSRELRPGTLDYLGLVPALRELKDRLEKRDGIDIKLFTVGVEERFAQETELALYRIVQECLVNTLRHARTTRADLALTRVGDDLQLVVEDQGVGFDASDPELRPQGLLIMEERARLCGGELHIESSPGKGTVVIARIPAHTL
ncbi:MAG: GAF domain-containing sensor histidine kinase [Desulfobacteraceae bacterium]